MPQRIQRKRIKGWKMPAGTVYVGRPTIFGNPFQEKTDADHARAVMLFRNAALAMLREAVTPLDFGAHHLGRLRGKDLACWCRSDQPCHADVLLEIANR